MADAQGFQAQLQEAIARKRRYLEELALPRLKEGCQAFQSLFESLYRVLLRKSLVQEDPYQYERTLTEVTVPPKGPIADSEKREKLSQRLSELRSQIEFLNTSYQFSLEFLNLERLKRVIGLLQYVNWLSLTEASKDATTAVLSETLSRLRLAGGDNVSSSIVSNALRQLEAVIREALLHLRELLSFQKEAYKLGLRSRLLGDPQASGEPTLATLYSAGAEQAYARLKSLFLRNMKGEPFYKDLVMEVLEEEHGGEAAERREAALTRLRVPQQKAVQPTQTPDHRPLLVESVRLLLPAAGYLGGAVKKLAANQELLERRRGWLGKLRAWLRKVFRAPPDPQLLDIRYFQSATSTTRGERLDLRLFLEQLRRKIALFTALADPASRAATRLAALSDEQLLAFATRNLGELQLALRRCEGASEALRARAPSGQQMKGIRIELSGLKNCLVRSNQLRYQYVSRQEEGERPKKRESVPAATEAPQEPQTL